MPYLSSNKKRIFISYSHQDKILMNKVCARIESLGLQPLWDEGFSAGKTFHDQIKNSIVHAHVFIPIITPASSERGWVHQEIGYAMALKIPFLPVAWGKLPDEMLHELQAIVLPADEKEHDSILQKYITANSIERLLADFMDGKQATFETAPLSEDRAELIARYANDVRNQGCAAILRQKGGLSSLHIPDNVISDPIWKERCGYQPKSEYGFRCLREERLALAYHAQEAGFKIIIDPAMSYSLYGPQARRVRLCTLYHFLSSLEEDEKYQVAFYRQGELSESITILDNWFYAESISPTPGSGYRQTIFTRHAPSMQAKIDLFDREFADLLDGLGWKPEESRAGAVAELSKILKEVEAAPAG